jgi:hypothetical protein
MTNITLKGLIDRKMRDWRMRYRHRRPFEAPGVRLLTNGCNGSDVAENVAKCCTTTEGSRNERMVCPGYPRARHENVALYVAHRRAAVRPGGVVNNTRQP